MYYKMFVVVFGRTLVVHFKLILTLIGICCSNRLQFSILIHSQNVITVATVCNTIFKLMANSVCRYISLDNYKINVAFDEEFEFDKRF